MKTNQPNQAIIIPPASTPGITAFGDTIVPVLSAVDTSGKLSLCRVTTPPGGGPPLHRHSSEDELFIITAGQFRFVSDGVIREGGPGTVVWLPRGTIHTYTVLGDTDGVAWLFVQPGGFEEFFQLCADAFANGENNMPDMAKIMAAAAERGIEILGPPLAQTP